MPVKPNPHRIAAACLALAALCARATAADTTTTTDAPTGAEHYVGDGLRLGLGFDSTDQLRGDLRWPWRLSPSAALIADAWAARTSAGGARLSMHWLPHAWSPGVEVGAVRKLFVAVDQNRQHDHKLTLGAGLEHTRWFWGLYASASRSGRRVIDTRETSATFVETGFETVPGVPDPVPFEQDVTLTTRSVIYEQAYRRGLGLRAGLHLEDLGLRVTTGLDLERGGSAARQASLSLAAEKFFLNSPHALELRAELRHQRGQDGIDTGSTEQRLALMYRYHFGAAWRHEGLLRKLRTQRMEEAAPPPQPEAPAVVRHETRRVERELSLAAVSLFEFDSARLSEPGRVALQAVADELRRQPTPPARIRVSGHTCDIGSDAYNLALSRRRASAVLAYLAQASSLPTEAFVLEAHGESSPRHPNDSTGRPRNRRVDLAYAAVEETVVALASPPAPAPAPAPAWRVVIDEREERVPQEPAWIARALAHPVDHKQKVDVFRGRDSSSTAVRGPRRHPPVAQADNVFALNSGLQGLPIDTRISVLANDVDADGDTLSIATVGTPSHGSVRIEGTQLVYTPTPGFEGTDSFTYTMSDGTGRSGSGVVTVTVQRPQEP